VTWLQLVWMYLPDGQSTVRHGHDAAGRERLARCGALLRGGDAREGRLLAVGSRSQEDVSEEARQP
jgi:hypothetical protein